MTKYETEAILEGPKTQLVDLLQPQALTHSNGGLTDQHSWDMFNVTRWIQPEQSIGAHVRVLVEERACLFSFVFCMRGRGSGCIVAGE